MGAIHEGGLNEEAIHHDHNFYNNEQEYQHSEAFHSGLDDNNPVILNEDNSANICQATQECDASGNCIQNQSCE